MTSEETGIFDSLLLPSNVEFLRPQRLWWLLLLALLVVGYVASQLLRKQAAIRFSNVHLIDRIAPARPNWRRHVGWVFLALSLAAMVCAYAEPAAIAEVASERATVILAVDTSLSMQAEDVSPSRIEGAKLAANVFLDEVPDQINVGLVTFNGNASVRVPPTQNRQAVRAAIEALELGESTAIGEAIFTSLEALRAFLGSAANSVDAPPARIVLMSDGETQVGRPDEVAVEAALADGVPVSTIAFGTDNGFVTIPGSQQPIPVPVNEEALQLIADGTGGEFYEAQSTAELEAIYSNIGSAVATEEERVLIGAWFAGRAMLLLVFAAGWSLAFGTRLP